VSLRRFAAGPDRPAPGTRCELCAAPLGADHGHVVHLEDRRILCACRPCALLFTREGAGSARGESPVGRYRAVPERYRHDPGFTLSDADWDELAIPVRTAFFFHNSGLDRTVACYPSPGGAIESELPLDAWARVLAANPAVADAEPDVEALLVDRETGAYLVPIDVCYALAGLVRLHWKGFGGGSEAWERIDAFFAGLRERSERVVREDAGG